MAAGSTSRLPRRRPASARRRLPAAERRALILDAALRTFAQRGYDGASMDEIAAGAGISKAVVYDHVASKHELYAQLLHAIGDEIERTVRQALQAPGEDGELRVLGAVEAIYDYVEAHPEASRLLVLELQGADVSPLGRDLEARLAWHLALTLGAEPALFAEHPQRERQLAILAELLKSAVLGAAAWWHRHPEAPREDLVERTAAVVWPSIARAGAWRAPRG